MSKLFGARSSTARLVTPVLKYMKENQLKDEMTWALGKDWEPSVHSKAVPFRLYKQLRWAGRVILFLILWLLFAVLTPVFYVLHAISCQGMTKAVGRISESPDLPLLFAVLSENADMLCLFLQYRISPWCTDRHGNTVYHYLADISAEDPDKFKRCHQLMKEAVDDSEHSLLTDILANKENDMGLSPMEILLYRGSIAIFIHLNREECCLGRLKVAVAFDHTTIKPSLENEGCDTSANLFVESSSSEAIHLRYSRDSSALGSEKRKFNLIQREFDVTKYEKKDAYGKQSLLLQLLASRNIQSMNQDDVTALVNSVFLKTWMNVKKRAVSWCLLLKYAPYVAVTVCLLWGVVITNGLVINRYPLIPHFLTVITSLAGTALVEGTDTLAVAAPNGSTIHVQCETNYMLTKGTTINGCMYAALLQLNESCHLDLVDLMQNTGIGSNDDDLNSKTRRVSQAMLWLSVPYLIIDFAQRTLFLGRKVFNSTSSKAAVINTLTTRLCGLYTDSVNAQTVKA